MGRGNATEPMVALQRVPDLQDWADRINRHIGAAVESILGVGKELHAAKAAVKHGEWERLFAGHDNAVPRPVPFGVRTAQMFMAIAEHPVLSETKHVSLLPASWGTLYELTKLPEPTLSKALNDGRVHPGMERDDAVALRGPHVRHNSGESEWFTPVVLIENARHVLHGIDVDPASCEAAQRFVKAGQHFTAEDDGLGHEWHGSVWMNPPYRQPLIMRFCDKLLTEFSARRTTAAITLTNNGTETQWGQALLHAASAVCLPAGRVTFWKLGAESGAPLQGQMICYLGREPERFVEAFGAYGWVGRGLGTVDADLASVPGGGG